MRAYVSSKSPGGLDWSRSNNSGLARPKGFGPHGSITTVVSRAAMPAASALTADGALFLQRAIGNRAVAALLRASTTATSATDQAVQLGLADQGRPLDQPVLAEMESFFGHDFTRIRVHTDARADTSAQALNARAYTIGRDVVFAAGQYAPQTDTGRQLLAHELAHTMQQQHQHHQLGGLPSTMTVSDPGSTAEIEAERVADAMETAGQGLPDTPRRAGPLALDNVRIHTPAPVGVARADLGMLQARTIMQQIADEARALVARYATDNDGLAAFVLSGATDWHGAQVAYHVLRLHPDRGALSLSMARWANRLGVQALAGNTWTKDVLLYLATTLRTVGASGQAERIIGVLVSPEHANLVGERASATPAVTKSLTERGASVQSIAQGSSPIVYDEYWIIMDAMPPGLTPGAYLTEMSQDLNAAVRDESFDRINEFRRAQQDRNRGAPALGDVYDIDILGPDNGSVVLVERTPEHFVFQTIVTTQTGMHPEFGSREFGFEPLAGGAVRFYTRGASRAASPATFIAGAPIQEKGWTSMLQGIGAALTARGGRLRPDSFGHWRVVGG
jgi:hypothetical protein